jgi:RNA methyltransferase, TrmH family
MLVKSKVKYIQTLGQKKFRDEQGLFIAEGPKIIDELVNAENVSVVELFAVEEWINSHKRLPRGITATPVTKEELGKMSLLTTPNQVLAVIEQFPAEKTIVTEGKISLALDAIRDPGNMGTILRIADWFGVDQVICSEDCCEVYNPKVVQSSMGSIARVKLFYRPLEEFFGEDIRVPVFVSTLDGKDIRTIEKIQEGIILVGNESRGISDEFLSIPSTKITIVRKGSAESLNAAIATGIILSHLVN